MSSTQRTTQTATGVALLVSAIAVALSGPPISGVTFLAVILWLVGTALLIGAWRRG